MPGIPVTSIEDNENLVREQEAASEDWIQETFRAFGEGYSPAWSFKNTRERLQDALVADRENTPPHAVRPWELRLGGSKFFVPPLNINVSQQFKAGSMTGSAIRQQSAPKFNTGHTETVIEMTLYFPTYEDTWGFEDEIFEIDFDEDLDDKIDSFLSSLRGLIAQFKYAPFLPIRNSYLNRSFGITGVALKGMTISTVPNYPFCIAVNLVLLKFNHKVFLPMIDHFDQAIHWGRFRCYSDDTEVLTREGWKLFKEVSLEDEFATRNPDSKELEWQYATHKTEESYSGLMYHFSGRSIDTLVTPNHRMLVLREGRKRVAPGLEERYGDEEVFVTAEELSDWTLSHKKIPMTSIWNGTQLDCQEFSGLTPWSKDIYFEGDDFVAFMGAYLSEGSVKGNKIIISQREATKGYLPFRDLLVRVLGQEPYYDGEKWEFARDGLAQYLRQFGKSHEKYVPENIKSASHAQLALFWEYYHFGDGSTDRGVESISTVSRRMADDLQEIIQKLGYSSSVFTHEPTTSVYEGKVICGRHPLYKLRVRKTKNVAIPQPEQIDYDGMVYCVSVPNGTLYVRRGGKAMWCGNSYMGRAAGRLAQSSRPIESFSEANSISNSDIDVGEITPSIRTAADILEDVRAQDDVSALQSYRRHSIHEANRFDFYFPFHTPARLDLPDLKNLRPREQSTQTQKNWWQEFLGIVGIDVNVNPDAHFNNVSRLSDEPEVNEYSVLIAYLRRANIVARNMNTSELNKYFNRRLREEGIEPNTPMAEEFFNRVRAAWFVVMYRLFLEDPFFARAIGRHNRRRRQLTINEWEVPMWKLGLDKRTVRIQGVSVTLGNIISRLQLQMQDEPTLQHIGGADTQIDISMMISGENAEEELVKLRMMFENVSGLARLEHGHGVLGFLGVQNAITELCGVRYVVPLAFEVDTVPNHPHVYNVRISLTDFDVFQQRREQLTAEQQAELVEAFGKNNPFLRLKQLWGCVDTETEILTTEGWKQYDQLQSGDIVLSINHETGVSEWKTCEAVNLYNVETEMLSLESKSHSSLTSLNHRWPTLHKKRENGFVVGHERVWRTSDELNSNDYLQVAAPYGEFPSEPKYSDDFVKLVAWTWTEGSIRQDRKNPRITICQSDIVNPDYVSEIHATLERYAPGAWSRRDHRDGMVYFRINVDAAAPLLSVMNRDKVVSSDFVRGLTESQLQLYVSTSMKADGHWRGEHGVISQSSLARIEHFELAVLLLGRGTRLHYQEIDGFERWTLSIRDTPTYNVPAQKHQKLVNYKGIIWCPTIVDNGSWLARRKGHTFFTGNSFNAYPDFPLAVRDDEGNIVGHLDPDYYFRSFKTIEDDLVESSKSKLFRNNGSGEGADAIRDAIEQLDGEEEARGRRKLESGYDFLQEDGVHLCVGVGDDEAPQYISMTDDGLSLYSGDEAHLVDGKFHEVTAGSVVDEPEVEGLTPPSQYCQPYLGGDDPMVQFAAMAKDMQYRDKSGRMVRAFPTYMLWLIDEGGVTAGVKMFDNFYGLQSVLDMSIVQSEDILGDTLVLRVSNLYSKLSNKFHDYLEEDNPGARIINEFTSRQHRMLTGLNEYLVDIDSMQLRPGVRLHLRVGYGADPNRLDTVFNGTITEVETGEIVTIIAQSDAMELSAMVNSANEKGHTGKIDGSMFGLYLSEPRDLMVTLLTKGSSTVREAIAHATRGEVFSENRFGIKHFGTMFYTYMDGEERDKHGRQKDQIKTHIAEVVAEEQNMTRQVMGLLNFSVLDVVTSAHANLASKRDYEVFKRNIYPGNGTGIAQYLGGDLGDIGFAKALDGTERIVSGTGVNADGEPIEGLSHSAEINAKQALDAAVEAQDHLFTEESPENTMPSPREVMRGATETGLIEPGVLRRRSMSHTHPATKNLLDMLGITRKEGDDSPYTEVAFRAQTYMKTVWDLFKVCAALLPDYIVAVRPFEERSTVFYGKPHWLYTSGVIPLSTGVTPQEGPPIVSPDEEMQEIYAELEKNMDSNDHLSSFEGFFAGISDYQPSDPTKSTGGVSETGADGLPPDASDLEKFLYGLRIHESGGDYQAKNPSPGQTASGAYQYIDRTWNNYQGYSKAYQAPPEVQDERARSDAENRYRQHGDWEIVAAIHFTGGGRIPDSQGGGSWIDKSKWHLRPGHHTNPTVQVFVDSVMEKAGLSGDSPTEYVPKKTGEDPDDVDMSWAGGKSDPADFAYRNGHKVEGIPVHYQGVDGDVAQKVYIHNRSDKEALSIWDEFREYFPSDVETERAFLSARQLDEVSDDDKQDIKDAIYDDVVSSFKQFMWRNPYARGWLAKVVSRRVGKISVNPVDAATRGVAAGWNAITNITDVSASSIMGDLTREWDFSPVYTLFGIYISDGDDAAIEYMKTNHSDGRDHYNIGARVMEEVGAGLHSIWETGKGIIAALGNVASGVLNFMRLSMMQLTHGLSMASNQQRQTNKLNKIFNDSLYYSAGVVDGEVVNPFLYYADNCLAGDTEVWTWEGKKPIRQLAGGTHKLLTSYKWYEAPVRSFGIQKLWKLELSRSGIRKTIYTTEQHRWFVDVSKSGGGMRSVERVTKDLLRGNRLTVNVPHLDYRGFPHPSPFGVARGFVVGDGWVDGSKTEVTLWGEKDKALSPYFDMCRKTRVKAESGFPGIKVKDLPRDWKELPSLDESKSFLYGWLMGLFAADGCVDERGTITFSQRDRKIVEFVELICMRLGIATYEIRESVGKDGVSYWLTFVGDGMSPEFFLIEEHRSRFELGHQSRLKRWSVVSVEETERYEEVFCAEVPRMHNFTLVGHILTGNCFTREYGEPVVEIREPFQRLHTIGSFQHIINNNIIESFDDVATVITATSNGEHPVTAHFDKGAPAERQFEKVTDTGLHWDHPKGWMGIKRVLSPIKTARGAIMGVRGASMERSAERVALTHLKEELKDIYRGELTVLGDASIRPHDLVYLGDVYSRQYGFFEVEQVIHHFTPETGFITSITPNACVTINDPARLFLLSRMRGRMDIGAVRRHARAALKVTADNAGGTRTFDINGGMGTTQEEMTVDDIVELVDTSLANSLQYHGGASSIVKSVMSSVAGGGIVSGAIGSLAGGTAATVAGGVGLGLGWRAWRWVRDNLLDQQGCYISYLTQDGQAMDAGLSYNSGVAVGHQHSLSLLLKGIRIAEIPTIGRDGSPTIRYQDVIPALQWDETGPNDNAAEVSLFVDSTMREVRRVSGRESDFLNNFASEVYWARVTNVVDGDTIDVDVLGHIKFGEFSASSVTLGNNNRIRFASVDAPEDRFKNDPHRAALNANDPGVRATNYVREHLLDKEVALRVITPNEVDQYGRAVAYIFHNAPDDLEGEARRDFILDAAAGVPVAAWDSYMSNGRPYTINWQLVVAGHGFVYQSDLARHLAGRGVNE